MAIVAAVGSGSALVSKLNGPVPHSEVGSSKETLVGHGGPAGGVLSPSNNTGSRGVAERDAANPSRDDRSNQD